MNIIYLEIAMSEAGRFLAAANDAHDRLSRDKYASSGSKETASCKRASLDLTRALAKLRRARY